MLVIFYICLVFGKLSQQTPGRLSPSPSPCKDNEIQTNFFILLQGIIMCDRAINALPLIFGTTWNTMLDTAIIRWWRNYVVLLLDCYQFICHWCFYYLSSFIPAILFNVFYDRTFSKYCENSIKIFQSMNFEINQWHR